MLHPRDVPGAHDGGADRLFLVDDPTSGGLCVEPAVVLWPYDVVRIRRSAKPVVFTRYRTVDDC